MSPTVDISHTAKRGMSLIELIVAMAIFTIIMGGVMVVFSSVTSTVRLSYRTMDTFEATNGALMTIEQDVLTAFSAPAIGADFHFYGEPNGFVFIGIAPDGNLGRLTYAVHADTSRISEPYSAGWRGEIVTLPVKRSDMDILYDGSDGGPTFSMLYPGTDAYVDVEVEVLFGVLIRYYESNVNDVSRFPELDVFASQPLLPQLPLPALIRGVGSEAMYRTKGLPWVLPDIWTQASATSVPWYIKEKVEVLEVCHYWMQMLNGPRIMPTVTDTGAFSWINDPYAVWDVTDVFDQFWYDHEPFRSLTDIEINSLVGGLGAYPNPLLFPSFPDEFGNPKDWRHFLWDHVVARDFVIAAWLVDPNSGLAVNHRTNVVDIQPVFQYSVESGLSSGNKEKSFNTLFNLNFDGAFDTLMSTMLTNPTDATTISNAVEKIVTYRQLYDLGNPLQSRIPSAFEVNLFVINPPVTTSAPTDIYNFAQTVHIPSGFLRRNLAVD